MRTTPHCMMGVINEVRCDPHSTVEPTAMAAPTSSGHRDQCLTNYRYLFQPDLFKGKVAFVTGGGSGIGFTITEVFMRHGCRVAIASRNLERLQAAKQKLERATGGQCMVVKMDVRKPQEVTQAVDAILAQYGRIDVLVNNAAGNFLSSISGLSFNAFRNVIDIDLMGTFNVSKVVHEKYLRDHGGSIINISATLYYRGTPMQSHAGAAKAGIDALTRHMAVEWGRNNVRVIALAPGAIQDTEGYSRLGAADKKDMEAVRIPLGRAGRKDEMAHTVLFLASEAASYVSGTILVADGGGSFAEDSAFSILAKM